MAIEKKEEKEKTETSGNEEQKQEESVNPQSVEPKFEASAMGKQLNDLSTAITAIANQGSVNESIQHDNNETGEEEYPTIDIDGINRLLGV